MSTHSLEIRNSIANTVKTSAEIGGGAKVVYMNEDGDVLASFDVILSSVSNGEFFATNTPLESLSLVSDTITKYELRNKSDIMIYSGNTVQQIASIEGYPVRLNSFRYIACP